MMVGVTLVRAALGAVGGLLFLGGVLVAFSGAGDFLVAGSLLVIGAGLMLVAVLEVTRYRSQSADEPGAPTGAGGGEPARPEARFQRTDEVFVDPTSHRRMRVFSDPRTGERRYVAEN